MMTKAEEKSKQYRDYREQCGIKDPIMLDEIDEAYYEGYLQAEKDNTSIPQTPMSKKEQWISETAVKLMASIPEEYVTSANGQVMEARHIYAARIAKEMADEIFSE